MDFTAFLADLAMGTLGGDLKRKEKLVALARHISLDGHRQTAVQSSKSVYYFYRWILWRYAC